MSLHLSFQRVLEPRRVASEAARVVHQLLPKRDVDAGRECLWFTTTRAAPRDDRILWDVTFAELGLLLQSIFRGDVGFMNEIAQWFTEAQKRVASGWSVQPRGMKTLGFCSC